MIDFTIPLLMALVIVVLLIFIAISFVIVREIVEKKNNIIKRQWTLLYLYEAINRNEAFISDFMEKHSYKTIAVYGCGLNGRTLINYLKKKNINIVYGIDRRKDITIDIPVLNLEDVLPDVDVIIVSLSYGYIDVIRQLRNKTNADVVLLDEVCMK